jgi:hypothetical protein
MGKSDCRRWGEVIVVAQYTHDARDLEAERGSETPSELTLGASIAALVTSGPREVHTPTLADAACDLWDALESRRVDVELLVCRFAMLRLDRATSGERQSSTSNSV